MDQTAPGRRPTIVGGSPMNRLVQASSLPLNIERLLIQAALSHEFRQRLMADRETAAAAAGIELLPEERALLSHISNETLDSTIDRVIIPPLSRRKFLKKAAASVVLALTGSAVLLQAACGGAAPDEPHSAYDQPGHYWANLAGIRCFVYVPYAYQFQPTGVLLAFSGAKQTSLELANYWLPLCADKDTSLVVADVIAAGLSADDIAARLHQLFEDANDLWGRMGYPNVLTGFAEGAALALQVGVRDGSDLNRIIAFAGLPAPGWETALSASPETRIYLRVGRQDLNAEQYGSVVDALRAAGCKVNSGRVRGELALADCPQKAAWRYVTAGS